jgi:hypothetical protein
VSLALALVLLAAGAFYLWTAGTTIPLSLHAGLSDRYNLLADAFLHLRLSVGPAPVALSRLSEPYNPHLFGPFVSGVNDASSINDDVYYHGMLYFVWGPAPAIVLLVPLHLLGFEPSASVTVSVYAIVGLGFALAILRVVIRQLGGRPPIWMCIIAGLTVSLCSVVPFILRAPTVTEDAIAGGYCFTMAGIWLAVSMLVDRRFSRWRALLMSLCFGLASGSRPGLLLAAVVLVPVYLTLRSTCSRRTLLACLTIPLGICVLLLLAYNEARFHDPLELGSRYQLTAYDSRTAPLGSLSYLLAGADSYGLTPMKLTALFPFMLLTAPHISGPAGLAAPDTTGGLLPLAPIVTFLAALPWLWRHRPTLLGPLAMALTALAVAGAMMALLASYEFFASTERYEVDFATLFVLGGLAGWLGLSQGDPSRRRRLLRAVGGLMAAWGCVAGVAISFVGYGNYLALEHPGTWRTLEEDSSPLSTAIAYVLGHPVLATVSTGYIAEGFSSGDDLHGLPSAFALSTAEQASLTVVAPESREAALRATVSLRPGARYGVRVDGPEGSSYIQALPSDGGSVELPVRLTRGVNRIGLSPVTTATSGTAETTQVMRVSGLSVSFSA